MTLDEFTLAYEGGIIPEFEISKNEFGSVVKTNPDGTFGVDIRALYHKIQDQKAAGNTQSLSQDKAKHDIPREDVNQLANWVSDHLFENKKLTWKALFTQADKDFGGTQGQGAYSVKGAYDAMELGFNLYVAHLARVRGSIERMGTVQGAQEDIRLFERKQTLLPTQSKRTQEQQDLQQFSTSHTHAHAVAWVANIAPNDIVLEPSAGTGNLIAHSLLFHPKAVYANEIAPLRQDILAMLPGITAVFHENANHLNALLPKKVKPTVVLMNPPFSADIQKQGKTDLLLGAKHITQALERLEEGGRLVAIVGRGMAFDRPATRDWWRDIMGQYSVRANMGIAGEAYRKFGTAFDNRILVIDKVPPTGTPPVVGEVKHVEDLIPLLDGVRHERVRAREQTTAQPTSEAGAQGAGQDARSNTALLPATDALGAVETPPNRQQKGAARSTGDPGELDGQTAETDNEAAHAGMEQPSGVGVHPSEFGRNAPGAGGLSSVEHAQRPLGDGHRLPDSLDSSLEIEAKNADPVEIGESVFESYRPKYAIKGAQKHATPLAESAAMSAVNPPTLTYQPSLPAALVKSGKLSDAQLESVAYAGQSHQLELPNGQRRGFMIGDGTGVGKGRQIAGIIFDNFRQGRKKAVWVSENQKLFADAIRDSVGVGLEQNERKPKVIFNHSDIKGDIKNKEGVLFTTYDTLKASTKEKRDSAGNIITPASRRLEQLVKWLGEDFDGVIAFDEAHAMRNALDTKGSRGIKQASKRALSGIELQQRLLKARVVYVSATGATEIDNLAYMERLGLWGEGTAFANKQDFIDKVGAGGVAAMEVVAKDMKAMGLYTARSLSYEGVTYGMLEHPLTPAQVQNYDQMARAWQGVLQDVNAALKATGVVSENAANGPARSAALAAFWSSHQRFFNQVLTGLQMPAVIADMEKQLKAGNSLVLQIVNTNEATQERRMAAAAEQDIPLEDLDLTPLDILMQYVQHSFPVNKYEEVLDSNGNTVVIPVKDSQGNPVQDPKALQKRDALLEELGALKVPEGPLEQIINHFGPDKVAEITGRKRRLVRLRDGRVEEQKLGEAKKRTDADEFMAGKKRILIFSDAGGTGRSYHADLNAKNQQKRIHYLLQPGWRADKAVQGLGRTHRTNQAQPPHYVLVTTNLKAQRRFLSSIARRLDQLGALTKGQRDTANQGLFNAEMNLENEYAQGALTTFFEDLQAGRIADLSTAEIEQEMGLRIRDAQGNLRQDFSIDVPQFLNRLLSLTTDRMDQVFDNFFDRVSANVEYAREQNMLDTGMETVKADHIKKVEDLVVRDGKDNLGETHYVKLELTHPAILIPFDQLPLEAEFAHNNRSRALYAFTPSTHVTNPKTGNIIARRRRIGVTGADYITLDEYQSKYTPVKAMSPEQLRAQWDKALNEAPKTRTQTMHMVTGALLPIWDRLPQDKAKIFRAQTDEGERILGREIGAKQVGSVLKALVRCCPRCPHPYSRRVA
ncbi:MAG: strawberry notch-like NTP hydrolase domain-containing protein [Candidatus Nitrosoglobus sp.]